MANTTTIKLEEQPHPHPQPSQPAQQQQVPLQPPVSLLVAAAANNDIKSNLESVPASLLVPSNKDLNNQQHPHQGKNNNNDGNLLLSNTNSSPPSFQQLQQLHAQQQQQQQQPVSSPSASASVVVSAPPPPGSPKKISSINNIPVPVVAAAGVASSSPSIALNALNPQPQPQQTQPLQLATAGPGPRPASPSHQFNQALTTISDANAAINALTAMNHNSNKLFPPSNPTKLSPSSSGSPSLASIAAAAAVAAVAAASENAPSQAPAPPLTHYQLQQQQILRGATSVPVAPTMNNNANATPLINAVNGPTLVGAINGITTTVGGGRGDANDFESFKNFLITAPVAWIPGENIRKFDLPTGESVSCVLWNELFHISGTDIVRALTYRFECLGRSVTAVKKFEEGIFSDLRNLKPLTDASLEDSRSPFLKFLYEHQCVRTQKKQKVFYWFSVKHDKLFLDALERDLKRESAGLPACTTAKTPVPLSSMMELARASCMPSITGVNAVASSGTPSIPAPKAFHPRPRSKNASPNNKKKTLLQQQQHHNYPGGGGSMSLDGGSPQHHARARTYSSFSNSLHPGSPPQGLVTPPSHHQNLMGSPPHQMVEEYGYYQHNNNPIDRTGSAMSYMSSYHPVERVDSQMSFHSPVIIDRTNSAMSHHHYQDPIQRSNSQMSFHQHHQQQPESPFHIQRSESAMSFHQQMPRRTDSNFSIHNESPLAMSHSINRTDSPFNNITESPLMQNAMIGSPSIGSPQMQYQNMGGPSEAQSYGMQLSSMFQPDYSGSGPSSGIQHQPHQLQQQHRHNPYPLMRKGPRSSSHSLVRSTYKNEDFSNHHSNSMPLQDYSGVLPNSFDQGNEIGRSDSRASLHMSQLQNEAFNDNSSAYGGFGGSQYDGGDVSTQNGGY